jgi:hypothetical protein
VPACAQMIFLSIMALHALPAVVVLVAGGFCWATTLALIATLSAGAVTILSVSAVFLWRWLTGDPLSDVHVAVSAAILFESAIALFVYVTIFRVRGDKRPGRWSIVTLHDLLHGVSS